MPGRTTTLAGSRNGPQPPRGGGDTWTSTWTGDIPFLNQNYENIKKKIVASVSLLAFLIELEFNSILCILSERLSYENAKGLFIFQDLFLKGNF